jgi:hypothetical protein
LDFVKRHQEHQMVFVDSFCKLVNGEKSCSDWIILFCMRELRYVEVLNTLNHHFDLLGGTNTGAGARLMNFVSDVNWVYDGAPWEHAVFFKYYWEKEHPDEPWPIDHQGSNSA